MPKPSVPVVRGAWRGVRAPVACKPVAYAATSPRRRYVPARGAVYAPRKHARRALLLLLLLWGMCSISKLVYQLLESYSPEKLVSANCSL